MNEYSLAKVQFKYIYIIQHAHASVNAKMINDK